MSQDLELNESSQEMDEELIESENRIETKIVIKKGVNNSEEVMRRDITDEELYSVYHSFDINFDELNRKFSVWRLNVIHIRGVQEMSSEDVLKYFEDFEPNSIEWVNDLSCNIVFNDQKMSAIAMIALTTAIVVKLSKESVGIDLGIDVIDADSLSVPVPPGLRWRLGLAHHKSKALLLRFATNSDKKIRGSRAMSQYYAKYGSPSIPSNDFQNKGKKRFLRDEENGFNNNSSIDTKSKRLRMRMRADDEIDLIKQRKTIFEERLLLPHVERELSDRKSIWERLDGDQLANYCAVDTDLLQIAFDNETQIRKPVWKEKPLRSSISVVKSNKSVNFDKNDLRSKLSKRKSY
jgi:hypothetical protein